MASSLTIENVHAAYGAVRVIEDVSITVKAGETVALLGTNGNGKSTLMKCIMGIVRPAAGRIVAEIDGVKHDLIGKTTEEIVELGIALVPEGRRLFPKLTVLDNVLLALAGVGPTKLVMWRRLSSYKNLVEKARQLLETAGYWERRDTEVRNLSHGEQRQIEVVLGLASSPKLLLLDEPAAGLSSGESREMAEFLKRLDPGLAILLIEHDMDVVFAVADRMTVMVDGRVLEQGTPVQIRASAAVRDAYLGHEA